MSDRNRGFPLLGLAGVFLFFTLASFAITECGESDAQPVSLINGNEEPVAIAMTGEGISARGLLTASDDEAADGYFALGQDLTFVAKPQTPFFEWLLAHRNTRIVVSAEPEP